MNHVLTCLRDHPDTRESDIKLHIRVIEIGEKRTLPKEFVDLLYKYNLASITRERARIQNTMGLYRATDKVRIKRAIR